jgi:glutamine synthetase
MGPQEGVRIADHSVFTREIVHAVAHRLGRPVTFTPIRNPASVGNGVHVHLSFIDAAGRPATRSAEGRHELSPVAAQFVAGILKYLRSFLALTAPAQVSYLRLTPHRWSAAFNNLGFRDREAAVRICPVSGLSDLATDAQFHFEFRAADAAASPYLQLAALVHAGCQGIEGGLEVPEATQEDLTLLPPDALAARGLVRLPQSLEDALDCLAADPVVRGWFAPEFVDVYIAHKRGELAGLAGMSQPEVCARYESVY